MIKFSGKSAARSTIAKQERLDPLNRPMSDGESELMAPLARSVGEGLGVRELVANPPLVPPLQNEEGWQNRNRVNNHGWH